MSDNDQDPASTPLPDHPAVQQGSESSGSTGSKELAPADTSAEGADPSGDIDDITGQVEQPAKVMRIGTMIKQLLEEVRQAPLDEAGRRRLREIHESSIQELSTGLAPELRDELARLSLPFGGETPSEAELRIAQAQLVGWLEGLFHGIQTALYAQQAAARAQLEQMAGRRQIGGGHGGGGQQVVIGPDGQMLVPGRPEPDPGTGRGTGQYL